MITVVNFKDNKKMKYLIHLFIGIVSILSCQKNRQKDNVQSPVTLPNDSKNYLSFKVNNDINLSIGELSSVNEDVSQDYKIVTKDDTIYIVKQFLESDDLDGKNIKILSNHKLDVSIKYNAGFKFMGDEKKPTYLPIDYIITKRINSESKLPEFEKINNDIRFQKFAKVNSQKIYTLSYNTFKKYYESIPENELKSCCPSDYENYSKLKKIDRNHLFNLDLEKQLLTVPDYKSIIIEIKDINVSKKYVLAFRKYEEE